MEDAVLILGVFVYLFLCSFPTQPYCPFTPYGGTSMYVKITSTLCEIVIANQPHQNQYGLCLRMELST